MLYFIPAWYAQDEWKEDEQFWHRRRMKTEIDDTVKQIQLFWRNAVCESKILLLSYAPNLRHFLHRQNAFRVPYWSVFDAIQEVRRKKQAVFSFHNLKWPEGIEFVYTPFSILAMFHQEPYANIEFGEYGNMIQIDLYQNGQISRRNVYDDRGVVSCVTVYENGQRACDRYLTDKGVWKLCHFADGHVRVNPRSNQYLLRTPNGEVRRPFQKGSYGSMEDVIGEVFASALQATRDSDIFCAAAHGQHLALLNRLLAGRKTIFSVFQDRLALDGPQAALLSCGSCIVADSAQNLKLLSEQKKFENIVKVNISPYDTQVEPGISQQIAVQKILLPVDHLQADVLEQAVQYLAGYLDKNRDARVHLFTRDASIGREDALLAQVSGILQRTGYPSYWARKKGQSEFEFPLGEETQNPVLFAVEQCVNEPSIGKCMREQRVLVDLADEPDLFLQIMCVGKGIPQILKTTTQYMNPGKNGRINKNIAELGKDLAYYLENLSNWNRAAIYSYELGKAYSTQYLIEQWKGVIVRLENNTSITVRDKEL